MIGSFGKIVFEVSTTRVRTFDGFARKGSAAFAEHGVLDGKPRLQHTGSVLDQISFTMRLDIGLGTNPAEEIEKLRMIKDRGNEQKLIIGGKVLGDFVMISLDETWTRLDGKGRLITAHVNIELKEFFNGS